MSVKLNMVIHIDFDGFDFSKLKRLFGQWQQCRFIQRVKPLLPGAFKLLKRFVVDLFKQAMDLLIELCQ